MHRLRISKRSNRGALLAELGPTLWVLFFLLAFPMMDLATITMRYGFFVGAARDAAHAAAAAKTFFTDISPTEMSAVNSARFFGQRTASSFSEITINRIDTNIVITNVATGAVTRQNVPLTGPADQDTYLYEIETVLTGVINPLITYNGPVLPRIPGFSAPFPITVASREFCEFPEGLNQ